MRCRITQSKLNAKNQRQIQIHTKHRCLVKYTFFFFVVSSSLQLKIHSVSVLAIFGYILAAIF